MSAPPLSERAPPREAVAPAPSLRSVLGGWLALDARSLALFRVGLALLLLFDLADRCADLRAHYTDDGVLPRAVLPLVGPVSLHILEGSAGFQAGLFVLAGLAALALLLGFHTRLAALLSWLLLLSLHARNPAVLHGGDLVLRLLLFWGLFLPLGARFSVDAGRARFPPPEDRVLSAGVIAFTLQLCFIYWFAAALKTSPAWHEEGSAIYLALSRSNYATPLGHALLRFPAFLRLLTFATVLLEVLGPLGLFVPFFPGPVRTLTVAVFVLFHLGLSLCMHLGPFPFVCVVGWLALLPAWFWDRLAGRRWVAEVPGPERRHADPLAGALALLLLGYVFLWNLRTVDETKYRAWFPERMNALGLVLGLDQAWAMFAPYPAHWGGWFVVRGALADGSEIDLARDGVPLSWARPASVPAAYRNARWHSYLTHLLEPSYASLRPYYVDYLCRRWREAHPHGPRLETVEVYFMLETTFPDRPPSPARPTLIYRHDGTAGAPAAAEPLPSDPGPQDSGTPHDPRR